MQVPHKLAPNDSRWELPVQAEVGWQDQHMSFAFQVDEQRWLSHGKRGIEEYCVVRCTGLPRPMESVFVKRLNKRRADGHDLLMSCLMRQIPHVPPFLGYSHELNFHYYYYSLIENSHELASYFENRLAPQNKLLTPKLIVDVINAILAATQEIDRRGFFYPDMAFGNMIVNPGRPGILLIDLDSCMRQRFGQINLGVANGVSQTWWTLFLLSGLTFPRHLNPTMVMSLALVLAHAVAQLATGGSQADAAYLTLRARPADQAALFSVLDSRNAEAFVRAFRTPASLATRVPFVLIRGSRA
jgi:hypothetical protein